MKHTCHWDGCEKECPPAMWGCKAHWFALPKFLRDGIWASYRPGQEIRKDPSKKYLVVAWMVQQWIGEFKKGRKLDEKEFCGPFMESLRAAGEQEGGAGK